MNAQAPELKRWFGQSKASGPDGEPQRFFHGTIHSFKHYRPSGHYGIWFAAQQTLEAAEEALISEGQRCKRQLISSSDPDYLPDYPVGAQIKPVYLKIQNPKVVEYGDDEQEENWEPRLRWQGYDGVLLTSSQGEIEFAVVWSPQQICSVFDRRIWGMAHEWNTLSDLGEHWTNDGRVSSQVDRDPSFKVLERATRLPSPTNGFEME